MPSRARFFLALDSRGFLAFPLLSGLLVKFALTPLIENSSLLNGPFKAPKGTFKKLRFADTNTRH
jgi:hypothetical protein